MFADNAGEHLAYGEPTWLSDVLAARLFAFMKMRSTLRFSSDICGMLLLYAKKAQLRPR